MATETSPALQPQNKPGAPTPEQHWRLFPIVALNAWELVGADYVGKISPRSREGFEYIHVWVDYFSWFFTLYLKADIRLGDNTTMQGADPERLGISSRGLL